MGEQGDAGGGEVMTPTIDGASADAARTSPVSDEVARRRTHRRAMGRRITGQTRLIAAVPALGFFISALVLAIGTFVRVCEMVIEFAELKIDVMQLSIELVEYADLFLLAVVLYILALGLITLFVTDKIPLPHWLTFHDFDDLKERLVSVISVMLGVYFLGCVLNGERGLDVLWLGLSCAVVIAALTLFVKLVIKGHEPTGEDDAEGQED